MTFALFMVSVLLFTGIVWLIDSLFFKKSVQKVPLIRFWLSIAKASFQ